MNEKISILKTENMELLNKNKYLKLRKSYLEKKIRKVNNQLKIFIGKLKNTNSKLSDLYQTIQELSINQKNELDEIVYGTENLTESIIKQIIYNSKINGYCRKYS